MEKNNNIDKIMVGMSSCGIAAGAEEVYKKLKYTLSGMDIEVIPTGCVGMCFGEPIVDVLEKDGRRIRYTNIDPTKVQKIVNEHILANSIVKEWSTEDKEHIETFVKRQKKIVLRNCGLLNPESIDDYIEMDRGYEALKRVISSMSPEDVILEIERSGLRGRGGAGFPTGLKWRNTRRSPGEKKYVICNADEGDPGAFMDRSVLEGDPHSVIEGMIIGAYAIGSDEGYIYCRAEYPLAVKRLEKAIKDAKSRGFLGKNILDSDFSFNIKIKEGAGAFVCGEETALIASIEGKRGTPRVRPPYPSVSGLWGMPTNINNVETWANIPWIIKNGAEAFNVYGTERSKGTKVFALAGKIKRGGLIEVPMGITIGEVVYDIGGGTSTGLPLKAVQLGGPSGGCVPAELSDTVIDYESLTKTGAIMGSGGMIVMDESTCIVDIAKFFLTFTQNESCGKCTPCRSGTRRMLEILTKITEGEAKLSDLKLLEELSVVIKSASLCGLGQTAPNPVLTTLRYFRDEYEAHIKEKRCPAGVCKALITFTIIADACTGCGACARICPVGAAKGEKKEVHNIDQKLCIKCGACKSVCKFGAIEVV
ncbi:MAG: NADH-quinone oxidoreductase subunit NuoF [Nitrospirae bacterium]|nr:MAG: NADH-quinone oxidoreductase subunit NuoF [Nitrospirota bacterium]